MKFIDLRELINRAYVRYFFPVPSPHFTRWQSFHPLDAPFLIIFGPRRWLSNMRVVSQFRRNLQHTHWTSLSDLYPRALMILYYYTLILWARYCGILETVVAHPEGCLAAELFMRYNCEIDAQVDHPNGRNWLQRDPLFPKQAPKTQALAAELWARVRAAGLPRQDERAIIALVQKYRQAFLCILQRNALNPVLHSPLSQVMDDKTCVAGNLWGRWSRILSVLYRVPNQRAEDAETIFNAFGMAIQVVDDMGDLLQDYKDAQANIFFTLVEAMPEEYLRLDMRLKEAQGTCLEAGWVRSNLPVAYQRALGLIDGYLATITQTDYEGRIASDIHHCVHGLLRSMI